MKIEKRRKFLVVVGFVLMSSVVSAQSISKWTVRTYNAGAGTPLQSFDLLAANVVCNQAPISGSTVNPDKVVFDDPINAGKVCVWTDPGTGPLFAVPFGGSYEATLTATNSTGTSPESTRSPFTRPGFAPGVPTGLKTIR